MILVLMGTGIGTGIAAAIAAIAAGQGIGVAVLAYSGGGMAGMLAAGAVLALCRGLAAPQAAEAAGGTEVRPVRQIA